jgi:hypothetical protein
MNTGNMAVGLAMPQCMCQWQSTQEKSRIETVPAQGTLLPKREWVGLTPVEVHDIWAYNHTPQEICDAVEAKLKEKNT